MAEGTKKADKRPTVPAPAGEREAVGTSDAGATPPANVADNAAADSTGADQTSALPRTEAKPAASAPGGTTETPPTQESDATTVAGTPIATTSDSDGKTAPRTSAARSKQLRIAGKDGNGRKGTSRLGKGGQAVKKGSDIARNRIASLVWLVAVLGAIVLSVGALLIALDANRDNAIVEFVLDTARKIDGPFWKIFEFTEDKRGPNGKQIHDVTKEVLVNWGLAAVAFLIAGRILDRVIRP